MSVELSRRVLIASALAAFALPRSALAGPADIMRKSRDLRRGMTNSVADVTMTIKGRGKTVRKMRQFVLEVPNAGNQTINVFSSPADVQGVSILTHSALNGDDQQWLFLPSVGRVKRIASSNRSGAFVGSDFAYEDLSSLELEKYNFTSATETKLGGKSVIEVAYTPRYSGSGYAAINSYLDAGHLQPIQNTYFNRRGEAMKTLHLGGYKSYGGGAIWRPHSLKMVDHTKGSSTEIAFSRFRADGAASSSFSANRFQQLS